MTPLEIRFDQALDHAGMEAKALADMMGISKQTLSAIKKGRLQGKQHWPIIARILHVDPNWLVTGNGKIPVWWIDPATGVLGAPIANLKPAVCADEFPPAPPVSAAPPKKRGRPRKEPFDPRQVLIDQQQNFIAALQATVERLTAENQALRNQSTEPASALKPTGSTP